MSFDRVVVLIAAGALLSGCHGFKSALKEDCHTKQDYQNARSAPPLKVPAGLDSPNTAGALAIPAIGDVPPQPGPHDSCLDVPPRYKPAPSPATKASGG
jgi:uncharacterized lipoprotein